DKLVTGVQTCALPISVVAAVLAFAFWILRRVGAPAPFATALLTAALFGLHPLQSQAVAYICQRAEVLAALFYLLALLLLVEADRSEERRVGKVWRVL